MSKITIGIVTREPDSPMTEKMIKGITKRGWEPIIISSDEEITDHYLQSLPEVNGVIIKQSRRNTGKVLAIAKEYEHRGTRLTTSSYAIEHSTSKDKAEMVLSQHAIDRPKTYNVDDDNSLEEALNLFTYPIVVKVSLSAQGRGVILAESARSARSIVHALHDLGQKVVCQEFIEEAKGSDYRIIVVDGKVVAAIQRSSQAEGEFRSNISLGGTGKSIVPSEDVAEIAIRTCSVFNTAVAGVDIIMSKRGPLVLELNISPGLEIENITGKDVVGAYLDYLVR